VMYYYYIQEQFQNLVDSHPITFNIIGSQIKTAYLQASYSGISQQEIYNHLVLWLESITPEIPNNTACQIVISFFVQNCEVFDEITK
ncbi:HNH endonuclease, partial [Streptococcus agalactiae]|nr:HNH endonuclease [Streptococcus agalactiae]